MKKIDKWEIVRTNEYVAPELDMRINGVTIVDGEEMHILTSVVVSVDKSSGTVTTMSGSVYELGEPSEEYEREFPGARERLFQ